METIIKEWFKRLPDWAFTFSSIIFLALLIGISVMVWIAVKRYADAVGRENKIIELQEKLAIQKEIANTNRNSAAQLQNVLMNARSYINTLNKARNQTENPNYSPFLQRIIEAIASDVKSHGGERHRCGLWLEMRDQGVLRLIHGSAGFPEHYIGNKTLDINDSIAGRAFRKKQVLKVDNVLEDSDWNTSDSSNSYTALICIPLGEWGVITIDARKPMDENAQIIGELYGSIIEGIMEEIFNILAYNEIENSSSDADPEFERVNSDAQ
jgi:hypothetical protein